MIIYTDGSYYRQEAPEAPGYATVVVKEETADYVKVDIFYGVTLDKNHSAMWNVGGELQGAMTAVSVATSQYDCRDVDLYFDYAGIEYWANGSWKTNKPATQAYKQFIAHARTYMKIRFHRVEGHKGILLNELADLYAKNGIMNYLKDHSVTSSVEKDFVVQKPKPKMKERF